MLIGDWAVVNGPTKNWGVIDGMGVDPGYMCFFVCVSVRVHFSRRRYRGGGERERSERGREREMSQRVILTMSLPLQP